MAEAQGRDVRIERPNRDTAAARAMRAAVIFLLLVSAALVLLVTIGGWTRSAGMQPVSIAFALVYLVMAFYVARWNRGVLPLAAALAMLLAIFAALAGPAWFDRDAQGFSDPALGAGLLGLITLLIVPVQILLIACSLRAFRQAWNVEVEVPSGQRYDPGHHRPRTA